jgi:nicotinamide-nucleotide amidase
MGRVKLVLSGNVEKSTLLSCSRKIQRLFSNNVFSRGSIPLEEALGKILKQKQNQIAVAESCTGGLLASQMVNVKGASEYFLGGVIAYSNQAKVKFLGLSKRLLDKHGAVSIPAAQAMAEGAAKKFSCQCGIGITGVAGPSGGTKEKPVGHVCIASYFKDKVKSGSFQFYGDRSMIRQQAVSNALFQMFSLLKWDGSGK